MDRVELKNLVGVHYLSGVQFATVRVTENYFDEAAQQVLFVLNGVTLAATEDPQDGYRSSLGYVRVTNSHVINQFDPVRVVGVMRSAYDYCDPGALDIVDFVDLQSMKVVLSIGTNFTDDYYPWFVGNFHPENLSVNTHLQEYENDESRHENGSQGLDDHGTGPSDEPNDCAGLDELSECGAALRHRNRASRKDSKWRRQSLPSVH